MNRTDALKILSLDDSADRKSIKKQYRALMHMVHPDAMVSGGTSYAYSAHEINAAYEFLANEGAAKERVQAQKKNEEKKRWNAPENEFAYTEREIYQYIEGIDGVKRATFCVATGKYYRIADEDYKLFLLSIYNASRSLLSPFSEEVMEQHQGEIAYLLFQQFIDPQGTLARYHISPENESGTEELYYIPAMLENEGRVCRLKDGDYLYPEGIRNHRLYVVNASGREEGYISFADDLIYYAVVPLFEQRTVQVRIRVSGSTTGSRNGRKVKVRNLELWLKMIRSDRNEIMQSISDKIDELLKACRRRP